MGTWGTPRTAAKMTELETLMQKPLRATGACALLSGLVGDDELFDRIGMAEKTDPLADIRPLIAMTLDLWVNWTAPDRFTEAWEPAAWSRAAAVAERYASSDVGPLLGGKTFTEQDAIALVANKGEPSEYAAIPSKGPGAFAVLHRPSGDVFRAECTWGLVQQMEGSVAEQWRLREFPGATSAGHAIH